MQVPPTETKPDYATFRHYLFFWSGQLVSLLGSSVAQFIIIWWITVTTQSALYLSLAYFLGLAPIVILAPFTGVFADRWNRKMLIAIVDLLQAVATVVLIVFFWHGSISIWIVLLLLCFRGVFQAFHAPTVSAITPSMVPQDKLSRMNGLNYLFSGAVYLVGPILAAILLQAWQIYQILWVDVATFLVAIVPLLMIRIPSVKKKSENRSFKADLVEGFSFIKHARGFMPLIVLATALNFLFTPFSTLLSYFVVFDHFGGATELALVTASLQAGILAGGLFMSVKKEIKNKMAVCMASIFVAFVGYALAALTPTGMFWFMALSVLILTLCLPVANVLIQTITQTVVPLNMQGRVNAVTMALATAAQPAGMIISGVIVQFVRASYLFIGCSLSGMLLLIFSWFFTDVKHIEETKSIELGTS